MVEQLLELTPVEGVVLDAGCGTGKYWELILGSGRGVVGVDQSAGMLHEAAAKHPSVPVRRVSLQELVTDREYDAVVCIDVMENVGPEDWPDVMARLRDALRPGGALYLTVEVADSDLAADVASARASGEPVTERESFDGVGYHHFPEDEAVDAWVDEAGLERIADVVADGYRHLLLRRPARR